MGQGKEQGARGWWLGTDDASITYALMTTVRHVLAIPREQDGRRLDQALAELLHAHSRTRLKGWIEAGLVRVDRVVVVSPRHKLAGGEALDVTEGESVPDDRVDPQAIALSIVYEDDALLIIDKPAGLVVHPGSGNRQGTLQNALLHHAPALAMLPRAGIVHRLDKDTSGLLVVAKTPQAQTDLVRQLAARSVRREYVAVAYGDLARPTTVDAPIGRHPRQRTAMAVVETGKAARTHVEVVERLHVATVLRCRLDTGRTHQIRVHLAAIGHPLVGDPVYRGRRTFAAQTIPAVRDFHRQALHAQTLGLVHPVTRKPMQWSAQAPADLRALIDALREPRS
jgi:23S rRNA pseudouridine1911/1915/1917 synthase